MKYIVEIKDLERDLTEEEIIDIVDDIEYILTDSVSWTSINMVKVKEKVNG